jgi:hypothetical protein
MKKRVFIGTGIVLLSLIFYFRFNEYGRATWNTYWHILQKVDDATLYKTQREVENTARAMQSSYKSDVITYTEFKDSEQPEYKELANAAKLRAIKTASTYNEYILKNSYVWKENIPDDISMELPIKF